MAAIDRDGFERYGSSGIPGEWTNYYSGGLTSPADPIISPGNGSRASQSLRLHATGTAGGGCKGVGKVRTTADPTQIWGFSFKQSGGGFAQISLPTSPTNNSLNFSGAAQSWLTALLHPVAAAGTRVAFALNHDGTISAYVPSSAVLAGSATLLGTTSNAITFNVRQYLEVLVTLSSAGAGVVTVKLNGTTTILNLTGIDTNLASTGGDVANQIVFGPLQINASTTIDWDIDDFYWNDGSGSRNNTFLGPRRIDCIRPTAEGTHTDSTPSTGVDRSATVDEAQVDTADYNTYAASGDTDSYVMEDLPAAVTTVDAMKVGHWVQTASPGAASVKTLIRTGGSDYLSASAQGVDDAFASKNDLYEASPVDGTSDLTPTLINGLEAGTQRAS